MCVCGNRHIVFLTRAGTEYSRADDGMYSMLLGLHCHPLWCAACVCTHCDPADLGSQVSEVKGGCGSNREMLQNVLIL